MLYDGVGVCVVDVVVVVVVFVVVVLVVVVGVVVVVAPSTECKAMPSCLFSSSTHSASERPSASVPGKAHAHADIYT